MTDLSATLAIPIRPQSRRPGELDKLIFGLLESKQCPMPFIEATIQELLPTVSRGSLHKALRRLCRKKVMSRKKVIHKNHAIWSYAMPMHSHAMQKDIKAKAQQEDRYKEVRKRYQDIARPFPEEFVIDVGKKLIALGCDKSPNPLSKVTGLLGVTADITGHSAYVVRTILTKGGLRFNSLGVRNLAENTKNIKEILRALEEMKPGWHSPYEVFEFLKRKLRFATIDNLMRTLGTDGTLIAGLQKLPNRDTRPFWRFCLPSFAPFAPAPPVAQVPPANTPDQGWFVLLPVRDREQALAVVEHYNRLHQPNISHGSATVEMREKTLGPKPAGAWGVWVVGVEQEIRKLAAKVTPNSTHAVEVAYRQPLP